MWRRKRRPQRLTASEAVETLEVFGEARARVRPSGRSSAWAVISVVLTVGLFVGIFAGIFLSLVGGHPKLGVAIGVGSFLLLFFCAMVGESASWNRSRKERRRRWARTLSRKPPS